MEFTKENVEIVINDYFREADFDACSDLIAEIYNLEDTTEKVVVSVEEEEGMKTSMFIDEVKRFRGLELKVEVRDDYIIVKNSLDEFVLVVDVDVDEVCSIDTRLRGFWDLSNADKIGLYTLCNRYIIGYVEDRNSGEKWALEHRWLNYGKRVFLNYNKLLKAVTLDTVLDNPNILTLLTGEDWEKYTGRTIDELMKEFKPVPESDFKKLIDSEIWKGLK